MKILTIGDVVGDSGTAAVCERLGEIKEKYAADFCVVNGENACSANGISRRKAEMLLHAGADVLTLGNHTFRQKDAPALLQHNQNIIRPINYPPETVGRGFCTVEKNGVRIGVFNALGRIYLENVDCPFRALNKALSEIKADIKIVDFHAEATSEKGAMAWYLDGRVQALWGTHTHVPTADGQVLPQGLGFVTDLGMTGPAQSVIGIRPEQAINRFLGGLPQRFQPADGPQKLNAVLFTIDTAARRCTQVQRLDIVE